VVIEYLFLCVTTYASAILKLPDQRYELFPVHKIGFGAMFNWSDMRFFLELARLRHLSATATRMRVDTSTVSRRIAELERSLNAKLFERAAEGFFLTEDGQRCSPTPKRWKRLLRTSHLRLSAEARHADDNFRD
jgi:Bacterial regulatory helix-turn-helix protein, lysR family